MAFAASCGRDLEELDRRCVLFDVRTAAIRAVASEEIEKLAGASGSVLRSDASSCFLFVFSQFSGRIALSAAMMRTSVSFNCRQVDVRYVFIVLNLLTQPRKDLHPRHSIRIYDVRAWCGDHNETADASCAHVHDP